MLLKAAVFSTNALLLIFAACVESVSSECDGEDCDLSVSSKGTLGVDVSPNIVVNGVPDGTWVSGSQKNLPDRVGIKINRKWRKLNSGPTKQGAEVSSNADHAEPASVVHPAPNDMGAGGLDLEKEVEFIIERMRKQSSHNNLQHLTKVAQEQVISSKESIITEVNSKIAQWERNAEEKVTALGLSGSGLPERVGTFERTIKELGNGVSTMKDKMQEKTEQVTSARATTSSLRESQATTSEVEKRLARDVRQTMQKLAALEGSVQEKSSEISAVNQKLIKHEQLVTDQLQNMSSKIADLPNEVLKNVNERVGLWQNSVQEQIVKLDVPSVFSRTKEVDERLADASRTCRAESSAALASTVKEVDRKLAQSSRLSEEGFARLNERTGDLKSNVTQTARDIAALSMAATSSSLADVSQQLDSLEGVVQERIKNNISKSIDDKLEGVWNKVNDIDQLALTNAKNISLVADFAGKLLQRTTELGKAQKQCTLRRDFQPVEERVRELDGQLLGAIQNLTHFATQAAVSASDAVNQRVTELVTTFDKSVRTAKQDISSLDGNLVKQSQTISSLEQLASEIKNQMAKGYTTVVDIGKSLQTNEAEMNDALQKVSKEWQEPVSDLRKRISVVEEAQRKTDEKAVSQMQATNALSQQSATDLRNELTNLRTKLQAAITETTPRLLTLENALREKAAELSTFNQKLNSQEIFVAERFQNVSIRMAEIPNEVLSNINERLSLLQNNFQDQITKLGVPAAVQKLKELQTGLDEAARTCKVDISKAVASVVSDIDQKLAQSSRQSGQRIAEVSARIENLETNVTQTARNIATLSTSSVGPLLSEFSKKLDKLEAIVQERIKHDINKTIDDKLEGLWNKVNKIAEMVAMNGRNVSVTIQMAANVAQRMAELENSLKKFATNQEVQAVRDRLRELDSQINGAIQNLTQFATETAQKASDVVNLRVTELAALVDKNMRTAQQDISTVDGKCEKQSQTVSALQQLANEIKSQMASDYTRLQSEMRKVSPETDNSLANQRIKELSATVEKSSSKVANEIQTLNEKLDKQSQAVSRLQKLASEIKNQIAKDYGTLRSEIQAAGSGVDNDLVQRVNSLATTVSQTQKLVSDLQTKTASDLHYFDTYLPSLRWNQPWIKLLA